MNAGEQRKHWEAYAAKRLFGKEIRANSPLKKDELDDLGWYSGHAMAIEFTDGSVIFPSADDEGNDAGFFSFRTKIKGNYNITGGIVTGVFYLSDADMKHHGWYKRPLVIKLTLPGKVGDVHVIAQSDPEGNDGGAVFGGDKKESWTFPVID